MVADLENLDLITPNRLILGRNNERCPNAPLVLSRDHKKIIENNASIFRSWFKAWLVSYLPNIIERPKWHKNVSDIHVGDIVLFLKSEKDFEEIYQYVMGKTLHKGRDNLIRMVDDAILTLRQLELLLYRDVMHRILVYLFTDS